MKYPNPLNIKVRCPKNRRIYSMQVNFAPSDPEFPLPVNGCDDACGEKICYECSAAITLMFYHGYEYFPSDVISPDFSILK